jgi:hypothetical protein
VIVGFDNSPDESDSMNDIEMAVAEAIGAIVPQIEIVEDNRVNYVPVLLILHIEPDLSVSNILGDKNVTLIVPDFL